MIITEDGTEITFATDTTTNSQIVLQVSQSGINTTYFCSDDEEDNGIIS